MIFKIRYCVIERVDFMSKIICLDAGHGGKDSGAIFGTRFEKNDNLKMAFAVKTELESQGFNVILTRESDKYVSLKERTDFANAKKADYFISIHRNAFQLQTASGVENWVYKGTDSQTKKAAEFILDEIVKIGVQSNRGVKSGDFHVTRETIMAACLLELNFISNKRDNELYDEKFKNYAKAICKGICRFFSFTYSEKSEPVKPTVIPPEKPPIKIPVKPVTPDKLYTVQIGAFSNKSNAQKLSDELKAKGYQAFIKQ